MPSLTVWWGFRCHWNPGHHQPDTGRTDVHLLAVLVAFVIAGIAFGGFLQIMQLRITENRAAGVFHTGFTEFAYRIPGFKLEAP